MAFNNLTSRTDAQALIPEEVVNDMITRATQQSAALQLFRHVPVSRNQVRFPVLSALPVSYFVTGDTGLKQSTEVGWNNKYMNIEEIATILPIPDNVVADVDLNIWDEAMPYMVESMGRVLDGAIFFGINAPASWPNNVSAACIAAGNNVAAIPVAGSGGYMAAMDSTITAVETDGFDVSGYVASTSARGKFRSARNTIGDRLDDNNRLAPNLREFDGLPIAYAMRGLFPQASGSAEVFAGAWADQFVLGVRKDITMKILDQAVIQDNTGAIIYNLAQQDMTAIRLTYRIGWQVANIVNYDQQVEANRYPAAVLQLP